MDIRFEDQVQAAIDKAVETFQGIDILVNNASAIYLAGTLGTPMKRFDLMQAANARATFMVSQLCIPHLAQAENAHILNISPPLKMDAKWFKDYVAYSMSKYGMSMCVLGMAEELRDQGIAVNALWPRTAIATAAIRNLLGAEEAIMRCRKPEIMADAAHAILVRDSASCTGNFFIDEDVLVAEGVNDLDQFATSPGGDLMSDFFV